jgi:Tol biopolymer transport system component
VSEVRVVPSLGGSERLLGTIAATREVGPIFDPGLSWSPDGLSLATVDKESSEEREGVVLISTQTGKKQRLTKPPRGTLLRDRQPAFSPDGRWIAFVRGMGMAGFEIFIQSMEGGEPGLLHEDEGLVTDVAWTADGSAIIFTSVLQTVGRLWEISPDGGEPKLLSIGENAFYISISGSGIRLAYSDYPRGNSDIWRVHGPAAVEPKVASKLISSPAYDYGPSFSPDGTHVALTSRRTGGFDIWICKSDGSGCAPVTPGERPRWSPDGRKIAFTRRHDDNFDIFVVDVAGKFTRRVTHHESADLRPNWSVDGTSIYFSSNRSGQHQVWKIPVDEGEPVQITRRRGGSAQESEDGFVYFASRREPASYRFIDIWKVPVDGGDETPVLEGQLLEDGNWFLWNHNIVYRRRLRNSGPCVIDLLDLDAGEVRQIADLGPETGFSYGMAVSPDGRTMLFSKHRPRNSDITLVENFR